MTFWVGKLEQFNGFLLGKNDCVQYLLIGNKSSLQASRFCITLDADTQLPLNTARQLVATLAHPLNSPVLENNKLARGYTIIQPLIKTVLPNATSTYFTYLFTDSAGIDPNK